MNLAAFIADPTLPLPPMRKKARERVQELRDAYQVAMGGRADRLKLHTPEAISELMAPLAAGLSVERLWMIPLDAQSRALSAPVILSQGYCDGTDADPRTILRAVLLAGAVTFVLVHNHPGGDPTPSSADRAATIRVSAGGRSIGVPLVDHVVIGAAGRFASLRRQHHECFQ